MMNTERMEVLEPLRDLQQLSNKNLVSDEPGIHGGDSRTHKFCARCFWMRYDVLDDVTVFAPVVDKGELEQGRVYTVKRENVWVR